MYQYRVNWRPLYPSFTCLHLEEKFISQTVRSIVMISLFVISIKKTSYTRTFLKISLTPAKNIPSPFWNSAYNNIFSITYFSIIIYTGAISYVYLKWKNCWHIVKTLLKILPLQCITFENVFIVSLLLKLNKYFTDRVNYCKHLSLQLDRHDVSWG